MVSGRNLTLPSTRVTNGLNGLFLPNQAKQQRIVLHLEPNVGNWPNCWNYDTHLSELCHFGTPPKFWNSYPILELLPNFGPPPNFEIVATLWLLVSASICRGVVTLHCHQISTLNTILPLIAHNIFGGFLYLIFGFFLGYNLRDQSYQKLPWKLIEFRRQRLSPDPDMFEHKNFESIFKWHKLYFSTHKL